MSNESSQYFYRKLGYVDANSLLLLGEPLEIIFFNFSENCNYNVI